jgi:hypothetical protein
VGVVTSPHCGPLAAWASAWLCGQAAYDDVLSCVDNPVLIDQTGDLAFTSVERSTSLADVLIAWRHARAQVRLVLPVAGDVRGLPGPAHFRSEAIDAGEAVFGAGIGLVPEMISHHPSSAPPSCRWRVFDVDEPPVDYLSLADAQHDLTEAIRESASALSAADVAGWVDDVREELAGVRRASGRLNLPSSFPQRAVQLIAQAERLAAVLEVAASDPTGGAVDRTGIAARTDALRPLTVAVRRARLAGYNALAQ